ncbi:hypothetical protein ACWGE0_06635 [Lentzea sp. NPDC054927]
MTTETQFIGPSPAMFASVKRLPGSPREHRHHIRRQVEHAGEEPHRGGDAFFRAQSGFQCLVSGHLCGEDICLHVEVRVETGEAMVRDQSEELLLRQPRPCPRSIPAVRPCEREHPVVRNPFSRPERDLVQWLRAERFHRVAEQVPHRAFDAHHGGDSAQAVDDGRVVRAN